MAEVYEGGQRYTFVSYAHADDATVLRFIDALDEAGYRLWYDAGIESGSVFPDYIARRVDGCACMVVFVSRSFASSNWCRAEVHRAFSKGKPILPVYLEKAELGGGMEMQLGAYQALRAWQFETLEALIAKVVREPVLEPCLQEEDGVKLDVGQVEGNADGGDATLDTLTALEEFIEWRRSGDATQGTLVALEGFIERWRKGIDEANGTVFKEEDQSDTAKASPVLPLPLRGYEPEVAVITTGHSANGNLEMDCQSYIGSRKRFVLRRSIAEAARKSLSDYSWAELKIIADMIASARTDSEGHEIAKAQGLLDSEGKLRGDAKPVTLTNERRASVRIAGFRHDEKVGGGKAGITFEFADVPDTHAMNPIPPGFLNSIFGSATNSGGWRDSRMRAYLNGGFRGLLPNELSSRIVQVRKRTNNRGGDVHDDTSVVTVTEDELWLLSVSEVYGRLSGQSDNVPKYPNVYDAEGTQYKFYADHGVSTTNYGSCKKQKGGADSFWWLRSPRADNSDNFHYVSSDGDWSGWLLANAAGGVSPCFCF